MANSNHKNHTKLLSLKRNNEEDTCFFGSMYFAINGKITKSFGKDSSDICFLRSLAKPLQASIALDTTIIKDFNLNQKELAIFQGSHSGTNSHIKILKNILKKTDLKVSDLLIEPDYPLDKKDFKGRKTKLANNCCAKHILMLILSKYYGFKLSDYLDDHSKLQKLIKKKQDELSNYNSSILTYDGCGTPLWGLPFKSVLIAFYNLLNDKKYDILKKSILAEPYIFGGRNRLDTELIQLSKGKLYSKVGAGGLVLVHNIIKNETLLIKMAQDNNPERRLVALYALNKLGWIKTDIETNKYNQKNNLVAKYCYEFDL